MGKPVPKDEAPYRPVDAKLASSVLNPSPTKPPGTQQPLEAGNGNHPPALAAETTEVKPLPRDVGVEKDSTPKDADGESVPATRKVLVREKRMLLTVSEEQDLKDLVRDISVELGVNVNTSNVLRACLTLLLHVQVELRKQCKRHGKINKRPRNNELTEIAVFEEKLARIFDGAIRNAKSLG